MIRKNIELSNEIVKDFRRVRKQFITNSKPPKSTSSNSKPFKRGVTKSTPDYYARYQAKLKEGNFDLFSNRDLMYFFQDTARDNGVKYVEAEQKITMRNFKLLKQRGYTTKEIVTMIAFLFESEQDYLDKSRLSVGILLTKWCNTIYKDSQDWLNDKYVPRKRKKSTNTKVREWTGEKNTDSCTIGEWE